MFIALLAKTNAWLSRGWEHKGINIAPDHKIHNSVPVVEQGLLRKDLFRYLFIEQHILDTNAGKQLS